MHMASTHLSTNLSQCRSTSLTEINALAKALSQATTVADMVTVQLMVKVYHTPWRISCFLLQKRQQLSVKSHIYPAHSWWHVCKMQVSSFSALTLLVRWQERHLAFKNFATAIPKVWCRTGRASQTIAVLPPMGSWPYEGRWAPRLNSSRSVAHFTFLSPKVLPSDIFGKPSLTWNDLWKKGCLNTNLKYSSSSTSSSRPTFPR